MALSASLRVMKATKPRLETRVRSSSVRGHMIFTLARGPYLPNSLHSISSFISGENRRREREKEKRKRAHICCASNLPSICSVLKRPLQKPVAFHQAALFHSGKKLPRLWRITLRVYLSFIVWIDYVMVTIILALLYLPLG